MNKEIRCFYQEKYIEGFPLGSTIQSKTKGIWMWCVPHPCKPGHTLVLLDTEGLGDVEKGDSKNDAWIFCLAVLLSSNFVINSIGTIDQQAMEQIHYVTELTKRIKIKSNPNEKEDESGEFKRIFPTFTWCVRDFSLDLELDGKEVTEDEYLMNSLKLKQGVGNKINDYNLPRECILHYFHSHKCFVFERPASSKKLRNLEQLEEKELEEDFVEQTKKFCNYMFKHGNVKTLSGGLIVTGRMLGNLTTTYINTIQSGSVPCMENAVLALSMIENTGAVQDALAKYGADMNQQAQRFPTETLEEFLHIHRECEKEAIKVFLGRSFNDEDQNYQKELKNLLDQRMKTFSEQNEKVSADLCQSLILELSANLENGISQGYYSKPGGHKMFLAEKLNVIESYNTRPKKGLKISKTVKDIMHASLQSMTAEAANIAIAQMALTWASSSKHVQ
ncbi:hypothetical protein GDO86_014165 [Hymenochirus boettgeri]|uniref:GB1/RHD3-type G domain-containing protein n=1 Tax=Hymenochirus boettgeri TaxID=247094 RepID=A0A8T2JN19_9PIPI|nr:hypothetical protein GDO86_014165 [Hymenochirus boettgeri]